MVAAADAEDPQPPVLADPLADYSILSLFSRTLQPPFSDLADGDYDIDAIHTRLISMELRSPKNLLEQARSVLHRSTDSVGIINASTSLKAYGDKNEGVAAGGTENPHQRRPSQGHKRAQFSLLPNSSEPVENSKPSLNIDILEDPEEYFSQMEKIEKAEKEMQRQRGRAMTDLDQNAPLVNGRRRRPSLLGKSASYKHLYSTGSVNDENSQPLTQETLIPDVSSPSGNVMDSETAEPDVPCEDPKATEEDQVSQVFDELMTANDEEFNGDKILNLLQERLNIQPIDLGKICLPDLNAVRKSLPESSGKALQMPQRAPLHQHDMMIAHRTLESFPTVNSSISRASPTPLKSPLASMSLLKKRISQSKLRKDPSSALDVDSPYVFHVGRDSGRFLDENEGTIGSCEGLQDLVAGNPMLPDIHMEDVPEGANHHLDGNPAVGPDDHRMDTDSISSGDVGNEDLPSADQPMELEDQVIEVEFGRADHDVQDSAMQKSYGHRKEPSAVAVEQEIRSGSSTEMVRCSEPSIESDRVQSKQSSDTTADRRAKRNAAPKAQRKRKELSGRKSLAAAGTKWESGVRRSTRIRTRPLEYWKGERLLYGRIHDSLVTVIGLKYFSPTKDGGQRRLKVSSYVPDEYKDLVDLVAQH